MEGRGEGGALVGGGGGSDCVRVLARTQSSDLLRGLWTFKELLSRNVVVISGGRTRAGGRCHFESLSLKFH